MKAFTFRAVASTLSAICVAATANARPMTEHDLIALGRLSSPTVSPDGSKVVYQRSDLASDGKSRISSLWLIDLANEQQEAVRIADVPDTGENSPAFAPDGKKLYFLAAQNDVQQLWALDVSMGWDAAPMAMSSVTTDIAGFALSPAGGKVALWGDIGRNCPTFGCKDDGNTALPGPGTGRVYDEMFVRHWDHWETPGNYSRAFAFKLAKDGSLSGKGAPLDGNMTGDTPTKPFGGGEEIAWGPDGNAIVYAARLANQDEPNSTNVDLWLAQADGSNTVNITDANEAADNLPAPSPDGKWLAWAAMERPGYESDHMVVQLFNIDSGKQTALTANWDRSVGSIAWAPDSNSLYVTASDTLDTPIFQVSLGGDFTRLTKEGHMANVTPMAGGRLLYTKDTVSAPAELFIREPDGHTRQISHVNDALLAELDPITYERFSFAGAEGDTVWGQIIKPLETDGSSMGTMPTILYVHGGPQGSFSNSWSSRWNYRATVSQGYGLVSVDFHGSTGYGQDFTDSINRDWGGKPLEDLKLGLAAALEKDPELDGSNVCAMGASYGGYMMNWIAGKWPDRFKCLVQHDGVFDLRAMAFETEELWFDEWDHGGPWWERTEPEKWNPVNYVDQWQTPMLVITGEKDFRIPYSQGLASFTALQRQDIPSRLLVFPDENHWVLKPQNSVQWHQTVFGWLDRWLHREKADPEPAAQ